jgi:hypothetical protein
MKTTARTRALFFGGLIAITALTAITAFGDDDPVLRSAKITFSLPDGDDKDDNTAVDVFVTTKASSQFEATIASLQGFANQQVWEDDGNHSYPYDLNVASGIRKSMVLNGGVKTTINWHPVGRDRCYFNYTLVLTFNDDSVVRQSNPALIELSENIRTYTF